MQYCIEYTIPWVGFKLTTLVVMVTYYIDSCTSSYHTSLLRRLHDLVKHDYIPVISWSRVLFVGLKECLYWSFSYYVNPCIYLAKNTPEKLMGQSTMNNPETQATCSTTYPDKCVLDKAPSDVDFIFLYVTRH